MKVRLAISLTVLICLVCAVVAPPVDPKKHDKNEGKTVQERQDAEDMGLEYGRYLQQVVQILEEDKDFAKKLENISADDIKSGKVAKELEFVQHNVRTKLDELKRMELERLRSLIRQEMEHNELGFDRDQIKGGGPHHIDLRNPHTFEIEDLKKLIKTASKDLDELNVQRKEEFKNYELEKEHQYRESLKDLNEQEKKAAETKHQESQQRHKEHPKIHHPGSKQQLEQVWEEQDQLPREEFNPSTFFAMHDINGDGHLDEEEVEAILSLEIKKMYDPKNTDDDPVEMMEEYHRMREHIYNETDTNKDGLISKPEFMDMTKKADFQQDDGWKAIDEQNVYNEEDLATYERLLQEEHQRQLLMQGGQFNPNIQYHNPQQNQYPINTGPEYHPAGVPQGGQQYHPQQGIPNEQQHPPQYPPQGGIQSQQGHPNQYPPQGHPNQYPPQGHPNQYPPQGHPNQYPQQGHPNQYPQQGVPQHQNQYPPQGHPNQQGIPPPQQKQGIPPPHQQQGIPPPHQQQGIPPQQQGIPLQQQGIPPQHQQVPQSQPNIPSQPNQVVPSSSSQPNQAADSHPPVPHQVPSQPQQKA